MLRRTTTALLLVGAPLLATPALAQQAGIYDVTGTNLDGSAYTGVAQIRTAGLASFSIRWVIGNSAIEGVGFASGRTVSMTYGMASRPGIGIYTLHPDGSMEGEWTIIGAGQNGRERLVPRPIPATPAPAAAAASPATTQPGLAPSASSPPPPSPPTSAPQAAAPPSSTPTTPSPGASAPSTPGR